MVLQRLRRSDLRTESRIVLDLLEQRRAGPSIPICNVPVEGKEHLLGLFTLKLDLQEPLRDVQERPEVVICGNLNAPLGLHTW
ncbi:MAG: hypothetical protein HWN66_17400 [Candidatus Helarchaeota archaeon]|nr:hypothetical protein [Candidatus Helarchaeota archaeon]